MDKFFDTIYGGGGGDFFFHLNLFPLYPLRSQGNNKKIISFPDMAKVSGSGGKFYGTECDLDNDADIRKMFDWIKNHPDLGQVDVCICNAGL